VQDPVPGETRTTTLPTHRVIHRSIAVRVFHGSSFVHAQATNTKGEYKRLTRPVRSDSIEALFTSNFFCKI
jgi:hypothetical protein